MQKAIRRGDGNTAADAAVTLLAHDRQALWRRLVVTAFEDIGPGSPTILFTTVAACSDAKWRKQSGGDLQVVPSLARLLAATPKDRSADYLIRAAKDHPLLQDARAGLSAMTPKGRIGIVADPNVDLPTRCLAAWLASGLDWSRERQALAGDLPALLKAFADMAVAEQVIEATQKAAARTRQPITIIAPLLSLAIRDSATREVVATPVPASPIAGGIPLYALDSHTRVGRRAIQRFARENLAVRNCLSLYVPSAGHRVAAENAAFYADAADVSLHFRWAQSDHLEALGRENDLLLAGTVPEGIAELLSVVRANLGHLNKIRAELFTPSRTASGMAP